MNNTPVMARLAVQGVTVAKVDGSVFISCTSAPVSLTVPHGVTELASFCFSGQDNLKCIYLIHDVKVVGKACFANCPHLEKIVCNKRLKPFEQDLRSGNKARIVYRED